MTESATQGGTATGETDGDSDDSATVALIESTIGPWCDQAIDCGCSAFASAFATPSECRMSTMADWLHILDVGRGASLEFDADCFSSRFAQMQALGCAARWPEMPPGLPCKMHTGQRRAGEACTVVDDAEGDDCIQGLHCLGGACVALPPVFAVGERCYTQYSLCEAGSLCLDLADDGEKSCIEMPGLDASCLLELCAPGLVCNDGLCREAAGLGESCEVETCRPCTSCSDSTGSPTCERQPPAGLGESCGKDEDCASPDHGCTQGACSDEPQICRHPSPPLPNVLAQLLCEGIDP